MKNYMAVVERCAKTGLYVGYIPGFPGAHSQGGSLDELNGNLREVLEMLLETRFCHGPTTRCPPTIQAP
ncbi:MAG: type II toxin-antitoxin system HicB family antitoxin [Pseudomonadota bacterium]|nr:type II toxin-antitoxin system HicB family antitoxin [Pseudomonadota bacterium]MDP1902765.1 type II toxin-antitoxin system HicB family antitoxin [Pseudomonadota bacterium]MDP2350999.1 type II toxin-antitoxin system HicB family antitoxin [Pseudomonadota bacterium]